MTATTISPDRAKPPERIALYLHVPFCARKCPYCDFNTYAGLDDLHDAFVDALCAEVQLRASALDGRVVDTIFIGGGTPTVLPHGAIARILDTVRQVIAVDAAAEISCEANPGTVDRARFDDLRAAGVNRLSIGAQSFDAAELEFLGRIHGPADIEKAVGAARGAGFKNLNLDLIFGQPAQPISTWSESLQRALGLAPEHLSLYSLIVETGTPLHQWVQEGRVRAPDDDVAAEHYEHAMSVLSTQGYVHYEVSNWALPCAPPPNGRATIGRQSRDLPSGAADSATSRTNPVTGAPAERATEDVAMACRHNLHYWRNGDWLACGPGAHGQLRYQGDDGWQLRRYANVRPVPGYIRRVSAGLLPVEEDQTVPAAVAMGETMMLGLRLVAEGVRSCRFRALHAAELDTVFAAEIARLQEWGMIAVDAGGIRLTDRGLLVGNRVFEEFIRADE